MEASKFVNIPIWHIAFPNVESIVVSNNYLSNDVEILKTLPHCPTMRSLRSTPITPKSLGSPSRYYLVESIIRHGAWHIGRCTPLGERPVYQGRPCDVSQDKCQNKIMKVGPMNKFGVVGIAIYDIRLFKGTPFQGNIWFCPNTTCHCNVSRSLVGLTPPLDIFSIAIGCNLTKIKIDLLRGKGLSSDGVPLFEGDASPPIYPYSLKL